MGFKNKVQMSPKVSLKKVKITKKEKKENKEEKK